MKIITSKDNPVLKAARKLHTRKGREGAGAFLIEGKKLISEAVSAGFAVESVFINAGALARGEAATGEYANEIELEETLFHDLAGTKTPQPYMAVVRRPEPEGADGETQRALVLDRISDPGNVGTMIRSAFAAGMDSVWCVKGTADVYSDKAVRASAGAIFRMPVKEGLSAKDCIGQAADMGARLFVLSAGGADLYKKELTGNIALVIGSEGAGPQEAFLEAADAVIGIPMEKGSESLNAATAAAVAMYEALRQSNEDNDLLLESILESL